MVLSNCNLISDLSQHPVIRRRERGSSCVVFLCVKCDARPEKERKRPKRDVGDGDEVKV